LQLFKFLLQHIHIKKIALEILSETKKMLQQYGEPQMEVIFVLLEFRMEKTLDILTWFSKTATKTGTLFQQNLPRQIKKNGKNRKKKKRISDAGFFFCH